ncbi:hypothetical protein APHAL10511_004874 [Amanita phalloides]|nr:hypothetical protein APHAL10511_004874 [Amanita phalloides]
METLQAIALPVELIHALNQTYFLHILANDPDRVIPPGKSLLSMLAHSRVAFENRDNPNSGNKDLDERIRRVAHKAFWDEVLRSLSSPQPSIQLHRLRLLYSDLKDTLSPLFPPNHPIILILSSPSAPSTSPLHSMAMVLKEILLALKHRCAPVRDPEIDRSMVLLAEIPLPFMISDRGALQDRNSLVAKVIVSAIQSIVSLSEVMKEDLNTFVSGTMTEAQLKSVVHQQAKARERELVLRLWNTGEGESQHIIREKWRAWVKDSEDGPNFITVDRRDKWKYRLLQALQSSIPVSCILPGADSKILSVPANNLPPQYLFAIPNLLSIQNYIQALVITAALRSLLLSSKLSAGATIASHFFQRVWTILAGEIEADQIMSRPAGVGETKIAHLADELVHARREVSEVSADEVARLRTATVNILRPEDPVYLLLQRRVMAALIERSLASRPSAVGGLGAAWVENKSQIPDKMKAGRDVATGRAGKRLKLDFWPDAVGNAPSGVEKHASPPKGFEDPALAKEVDGLSLKVVSSVKWIEDVWGDDIA